MPALLKNPVFEDTVYAEPEESANKATAGLLGEFPCVKPEPVLEIGSSFDIASRTINNSWRNSKQNFTKCYNN